MRVVSDPGQPATRLHEAATPPGSTDAATCPGPRRAAGPGEEPTPSTPRLIGNEDLIRRRNHRLLPLPPGGMLSDYVPFYFTLWSPMLYNIKTGYQGEALVHRHLPCEGLFDDRMLELALKRLTEEQPIARSSASPG